MKKILVLGLFGVLFFAVSKVQAGVPLAQLDQVRTNAVVPAASTNSPTTVTYPQTPTWNTVLAGSSAPASGAAATVTLSAVQSTMTYNGGVSNSTFSAKVCITDLTVQLSSGSTFYLLDGGTTDYVVYGAANLPFSGATLSTWNKHWDHMGPWCGSTGNAVTLSIPAPTTATSNNAISVDGYSVFTGLSSIYNAGQ